MKKELACVRRRATNEANLHGSFTFVAGLAASWDVGDQPVPAQTVGASRDDLRIAERRGQESLGPRNRETRARLLIVKQGIRLSVFRRIRVTSGIAGSLCRKANQLELGSHSPPGPVCVYSASVTRVKGADLGLRCLSIFQSRSRKC